MSGSEDLTPQEMADNIRAMRRAEEVTQEQSGAFAAQPGWTVSTTWISDYAAPHGAAFHHGIARRDGEGHLREHALQAGIQRNQSGPPLPLRQGGH